MKVWMSFLPAVILIWAAFFMKSAWRNRRQRALRRDMKRHLQRIGTLGPYDPANS